MGAKGRFHTKGTPDRKKMARALAWAERGQTEIAVKMQQSLDQSASKCLVEHPRTGALCFIPSYIQHEMHQGRNPSDKKNLVQWKTKKPLPSNEVCTATHPKVGIKCHQPVNFHGDYHQAYDRPTKTDYRWYRGPSSVYFKEVSNELE